MKSIVLVALVASLAAVCVQAGPVEQSRALVQRETGLQSVKDTLVCLAKLVPFSIMEAAAIAWSCVTEYQLIGFCIFGGTYQFVQDVYLEAADCF